MMPKRLSAVAFSLACTHWNFKIKFVGVLREGELNLGHFKILASAEIIKRSCSKQMLINKYSTGIITKM